MPLKVSDGIGAWIKDFQKSDAPQFKGKNKDERRDMAVAAYLTAKRGPEKENVAHDEAMDAKRKAEMDRAMAAFKKRGGKVKRLPPGRAQGAHGKDDPGKGMAGMLDRGDTKKFGTRKRVGSMRESSVYEAIDPKIQRVKMLARAGLVGRSDVNKLMMAMKAIDDGKELNRKHRNIIFDAFNDLIDLVTGDTTVFQKAKKAVRKEAVDPSDTGGAEETSMAMKQVKAMRHFLDGIEMRVKSTGDMEEWYQNKLTKANDYLKTLYSYGKGDESVAEKRLMKGIDVDDDTLRMFMDNPKMVPNSAVFRRLDPKTQRAVRNHMKARGK